MLLITSSAVLHKKAGKDVLVRKDNLRKVWQNFNNFISIP